MSKTELTDKEAEQIMKASVSLLVTAILDIIQGDPYSWSERPCQSCRTISGLIGKPFGCYKYAEKRHLARKLGRNNEIPKRV